MSAWIQTYSGGAFNLEKPCSESVRLIDIAAALSKISRFGGHTKRFYSVAEHCIRCCNATKTPSVRWAALVHDAPEAYYGDITRPMRALLSGLSALTLKNIDTVVYDALNVSEADLEAVKEIDALMLSSERYYLLLPAFDVGIWPTLPPPLSAEAFQALYEGATDPDSIMEEYLRLLAAKHLSYRKQQTIGFEHK